MTKYYGIIRIYDNHCPRSWVIDRTLVKKHGYSAIRCYRKLQDAEDYAEKQNIRLKKVKELKYEYYVAPLSESEYKKSKVYYTSVKKPVKSKNENEEKIFIVDF